MIHLSGARKVLLVESGSVQPKAPGPGQCPLALATGHLSEDHGKVHMFCCSESNFYRFLKSGHLYQYVFCFFVFLLVRW